MKYLEYVNSLLMQKVASAHRLAVFGQNVAAGSYLGGLTAGVKVKNGSIIINSTNAENSLVGLGFGLMLSGANAIFFMRQIDFLLLAVEPLVNTFNIIRNLPEKISGSFTIMTTVIDQGYEGPQSSLNNLSDFCSLARIQCLTVTNKIDAGVIVPKLLVSPGFRIIAASTRMLRAEMIIPEKLIYKNSESSLFQYEKGKDATVVCFNFSFPQGLSLCRELGKRGIKASLFNVNSAAPIDWARITADVSKTRKIIVLDDSKSLNLPLHSLLSELQSRVQLEKKIVVTRKFGENWLCPNPDRFEVDTQKTIDHLLTKTTI